MGKSVEDTYGLNLACSAKDLPKSTVYYQQKHRESYEEKVARLLPRLEYLTREHPEYGAPRVMPELLEDPNVDVYHKVIEHLLGT